MSEPIIQVKNVRKEFGKKDIKVIAIDDISLEIQENEVVLIIGPSGSGKTTLLSMMGCILTPTKGEIIILGKELSTMNETELILTRREKIGFVFQSFNLLKNLTVRENVEVALNLKGIKGKEAKEEAKKILKEVGLEKRLDFYPEELSGGEKQRISIARALVKNPLIVLADEPTGNLDSKTGHTIAELLQNIAKNKDAAVVIVTHDTRIEDIADKIIYLEDGRILERC